MKKHFFYIAIAALVVSSLVLKPGGVQALDCVTNTTGNWSSAAIWNDCGGGVPGIGDTVKINVLNTVSLDTDVTLSQIRLGMMAVLTAGNHTINLSHTQPLVSLDANDVLFDGETGTVRLSDADHTLNGNDFIYNNLVMEPLTAPRTITIGSSGNPEAITVNGTFISGSSAANTVSFAKGDTGSNVANAVTSYYCASNGGIANITCIPCGPADACYDSNPTPGGGTISMTTAEGTDAASALTVSETGNAALDVTGITVTGPDAGKFSVSPTSFSIADGGADQDVTVTCDGSAAGVFNSAILEVAHNADGSPTVYPLSCTVNAVPVPGYGSAPAPGSAISMTTAEGTDAASALTVSETGDATLDVTEITVTGADEAKFSVSPASFNIADNDAAQEVTITCDGSTAGVFNATLEAAHNADGSPATYSLSCTVNAVSAPSEPAAASVMYMTSTATDGSYAAGDVIELIVRFSLTVWVSGTPQLVLNTGGAFPAMAYYSGGSGTDTLTFQYTVAAGDTASALEYWSQWALELNGGRIWDNMGNDVIRDLPAPGAPGSLSGDITLSLDTDYPVFRLYCHLTKKHLFTMDENEKDTLIALADADGAAVWRDEDIAYYAFHPLQYKAASRLQRNTLQAVHRFYSEALQTHLFTVDENEKEHLIADAADVWKYEGPAFYVPAGNQDDTVPVYRFYSEALLVHLFTTDENEKNHLIDTAADVWRFEGVAYYAYP